MYIKEKGIAIKLRKAGKSYSEILKYVHVAKSTLALWLKEVGLSVPQKQRLTQKRLDAVKRGGEAKRQQRLDITKKLMSEAAAQIGKVSKRELFLIGVVLYWAEGSKQKAHNPSERVTFSNSDPEMIKVFLRWLHAVGVKEHGISFSIYLHETSLHRIEEVKEYWSKTLKLSINRFEKIYNKPSSGKSFRRNIGIGYYGQIRISIAKSTNLNRRIDGWVMGISKGMK